MADCRTIEAALKDVRDETSFINRFLKDTLDWPIADGISEVEDMSFIWTAEELKAEGLDKHISQSQIKQLQKLTENQPWGIFLIEFKNDDVFTTGKGLTGPLRKILRGLVPKARRKSNLPAWNREHLLFICTHNYEHFRFAYFKTPKNGQTAPLATFGWGLDIPCRTACEFNLPALEWPEDTGSPQAWVEKWQAAFDVEQVTKRFYEDYANTFAQVEELISKQTKFKDNDLRMYTQTLFNRLMFLRFIERKGWLKFQDRKDYLLALYEAGGIKKKTLYDSRIRSLFFEGLAVEGHQQSEIIGDVPYLNGGLFEQDKLDNRVADLSNEIFEPIISKDGLFYRYNFTVQESTPLDIEVAVDPEMLGKVFEELVTGRHESGSYYTPRPIVSFMCKEALKGYLANKTEASAESIATLVDKHQIENLTESHGKQILDALDNLKAVDPACGSGAYLLGLLQELIAIYRLLYSEKLVKDSRSLYELKLRIIGNNLYGVDIDEFATNIAMLRLWLSLAVEADKPLPLPNLDFKIETGDSVTSPDPSGGIEPGFHRELMKRYVEMQKTYLNPPQGTDKTLLLKMINDVKKGIIEWLHSKQSVKGFDWQVEFLDVFANGGFDVVLANPPYVRHELILDKTNIQKNFTELYSGSTDLYCYFYGRAIQLLRKNGVLAFISSNKWLRANYGRKLRSFLAKHCQIKSITDFGDLPVFQNTMAYPLIFIGQKKGSTALAENEAILTEVKTLEFPYPDINATIRQFGQVLSRNSFQGEKWMLSSKTNATLLEKLQKHGTPLFEYVKGRIYFGIKTCLNEAYLIDNETKTALIKKNHVSSEIIKPVVIGRNIKKWVTDSDDMWLILLKISTDIKKYPAIYDYLKRWQKELENRSDKGEQWWELRPCAYYDIFEKPKILWGNMSIAPNFAYSNDTLYTIAPANVIAIDDLYLLGILNSEVSKQFFSEVSIQRGGGYLEFKPMYVKQLPIADASSTERSSIEKLVKKCLDAKGVGCEKWEREIDERVAALYGL